MKNSTKEAFLIHVMNSGFERAAGSFSRMINRNVRITSSQSVLVRHDNDMSYISEEEGDLYVLTTQIIGDVSGKSFLIFNQDESNEIFQTLNPKIHYQELNEAFLMEIDNIISASVISDLSNALDIEVYGDVPNLHKIHSRDLQPYMELEVKSDDPSTMIFANTTFVFETHERIHPQFIWKLNSKIYDLIPSERIIV